MERLNGIETRSRIVPGIQGILKLVGFAILLCVQAAAFGQWTEPVLMRPPINAEPQGSFYYSTVSADGEVLCMTIFPGLFGDDDVYISERIDDSTWTTPVNAGPNVNNNQRNLSPSITSDRQRLYYVKWTGSSYDLFVSYRTGPEWDDWTVGEALPEPVNVRQEFTGQISFDDSTLVFTSDGRPGPLFGQEVMCTSRLQPDSSWSEPIIIAPHLNQINGSRHPCLTDSGQTLVYGMFGGPSVQLDVFYAVRNDTGFGNAIRCDTTINTAFWDSSPSCPADGSYVIFDSRRNWPQGAGAAQLFIARRTGTPVTRRPRIPREVALSVYPNPFNSSTRISVMLPVHIQTVDLSIHNVLGQEIIRRELTATNGQAEMTFDGATFTTGIYLISATAADHFTTAKMLLQK